jgi:hypothetical protein
MNTEHLCKSCGTTLRSIIELGRHVDIRCQRIQERNRVFAGKPCPQCSGIGFHAADCPLWRTFRDLGLT